MALRVYPGSPFSCASVTAQETQQCGSANLLCASLYLGMLVSSYQADSVSMCPSSHLTCALDARLMCRVRDRSGDSTARIWDLSKLAEGGEATSISLPHSSPDDKEKPKDVTTLDWSGNGQLLATGSYDGLARVWSKEGGVSASGRNQSLSGLQIAGEPGWQGEQPAACDSGKLPPLRDYCQEIHQVLLYTHGCVKRSWLIVLVTSSYYATSQAAAMCFAGHPLTKFCQVTCLDRYASSLCCMLQWISPVCPQAS